MKNLIKYMTSLLLCISLLTTAGIAVSAAELSREILDVNQKGAIVIDYRHDDTPLDDVEFKMYHITALGEKGEHELLEKYKNVAIEYDRLNDNDYWVSFRNNLENFINSENIESDQTFKTDSTGKYKLENLELGIYFIQAEAAQKNDVNFFSEPILLEVGHLDIKDNKWVYNYNLQPKIAIENSDVYDIDVKKLWKNTNSDLLIPKEIEVELYKDGKAYEKVILNEANNWSHTWKDINPLASWAIKELGELKDFKVSYEKNMFDFIITNTYVGTPDEELPQTGTNANLIPVFSGAGLILILVGILLKFKAGRNEN